MSRRARHGRNPHQHPSARPARPGTPAVDNDRAPAAGSPAAAGGPAAALAVGPEAAGEAVPAVGRAQVPPPVSAPEPVRPTEPVRAPEPVRAVELDPARERPADGVIEPSHPTCTQAQLRRFIKSRPWIPMHELRRRFGINGQDDDVSPVRVGDRTLFVGLPPAEGWMIGELLYAGDVGCELSLDPVTPVIIGVYPMRPVPRS